MTPLPHATPLESLAQRDLRSLAVYQATQALRAATRRAEADALAALKALPELEARVRAKEEAESGSGSGSGGVADADKVLQAVERIAEKLRAVKLAVEALRERVQERAAYVAEAGADGPLGAVATWSGAAQPSFALGGSPGAAGGDASPALVAKRSRLARGASSSSSPRVGLPTSPVLVGTAGAGASGGGHGSGNIGGLSPLSLGESALSAASNQHDAVPALELTHLLRRGHFAAAGALAPRVRTVSGRQAVTQADVDMLRDANQVHRSLLEAAAAATTVADSSAAAAAPVLAWCAENRWMLRRLGSSLEVDVRLRQFLEMVHRGEAVEAVAFARKHLSPHVTERRVQRAMGALAFAVRDGGEESADGVDGFGPRTLHDKDKAGDDVEMSNAEDDRERGGALSGTPYAELLTELSWSALAESFRTTSAAVVGWDLGTDPLRASVRAGLSALLTPVCRPGSVPHPKCPCCDMVLGHIAQHVPRARRERSVLRCRVTGNRMEEDLCVLPNGQAYSRAAIERLTTSDGRVTDPATHAVFLAKDVRRAYVL